MTKSKWYAWFLSNCDSLVDAVDVLGLSPMDAIRALKEARHTTIDNMSGIELAEYQERINTSFWETVADIKAIA